jgi:lysozyme
MLQPLVLDAFHGDVFATNWAVELKAGGFVGVIHKATQGILSHDPLYASRRQDAMAAGLKWGAYDFNTGDPPDQQVSYAMRVANPTADNFFAIDFEDNSKSEMSLAMLVAYLKLADAALTQLSGRPRTCAVYSGNRMKELIVRADQPTRDFLALRKFWLCEYGAAARMTDANGKPLPWATWWLWQRDADGFGPDPHDAPGIVTKNIDLNVYAGTAEQLSAEWAA